MVGARVVGRSRRPDLVFLWGQWGITIGAAAVLGILRVFGTPIERPERG